MKFAATVLLFISLFSSSAQALTVISDFDDTIKITRVNTIYAVFNSILSAATYLGMPALLNAYKADPHNQTAVVSGSPSIISPFITNTLVINNLNPDALVLTGSTPGKLPALIKAMESTRDDVILFGDDQESDPDFYQELKRRFPEQVKAIYIHQLRGRVLPEGENGFLTAYEIALKEKEAGRLTQENVDEVKAAIINELELNPEDEIVTQRMTEYLIPSWQTCNDVTRALFTAAAADPSADQKFLDRIHTIAAKNCGL